MEAKSFSLKCSPFAEQPTMLIISALQTRTFANSIDLDEMAHNEPFHQDLHCLLFSIWLTTSFATMGVFTFKNGRKVHFRNYEVKMLKKKFKYDYNLQINNFNILHAGKKSAEDIMKYFSYFFFFFFTENRLDISCKVSPQETLCMKWQAYFMGKVVQNVVCWNFYPAC